MRFLSLFLSSLIFLHPVWAQSGSPVPTESTPDVPLHVHLVDDPGPAQPQSTAAKGYVLQVTDAAGAPVAGAAIALRLPEDGTTGRFANGLRAWVSYSDSAGIVRFPAIEWGANVGQVELKVTAAKGPSHAGMLISQRVGTDSNSLSVVSVPLPAATPVKETGVADNAAVAALGFPHQQVLGFQLPPADTSAAVAVAPKPASLPMPEAVVTTPQPGAVFQPLADTEPLDVNTPSMNISHSGGSAPTGKAHSLTPNPPKPSNEASTEPMVSITNSPTGAGGAESHKKMWILIGVGAGAGAAAMLGIMAAHSAGGGAAGGGSSSGVTVGGPTISLGH